MAVKRYPDKTCDVCGKVFSKGTRQASRWNRQTCCSRTCAGKMRKRPLGERFWAFASKGRKNDCWQWNGSVNNNGYGRLNRNGRIVYAHRLSYELAYGCVPDGVDVLHRCDNPPCVNPTHLFLGTQADNNLDCREKGRHSCGIRPRGERHSRAKLTERDVKKIHRLHGEGKVSHKLLGEMFGVSRSAISLVLSRKNWSHV